MRSFVKGLAVLIAAPALLAGSALAQEQVGGASTEAPEAPAASGPAPALVAGEIIENIKPLELRDGQYRRSERMEVRLPSSDPTVIYTFTNQGATIYAAHLQHERYQRDAMPEIAGVPDNKRDAGHIDVISTWSSKFLPYRLVFKELSVPDGVTRVMREATGGAIRQGKIVAPTPAERAPWEVDRPVAVGDKLIIASPTSVAGEYVVAEVGFGGAITPNEPFAVTDVEGVTYTVKRSGAAKTIFEADPAFTRVSDRPGLPAVYVWPDPARDESPLFIEKRFEAGAHPYELNLTVVLHNTGDKTVRSQMGLRLSAWQHPAARGGNMFARPTNIFAASCYTNESLERHEFPSLHEEAVDNAAAGQAAKATKPSEPNEWKSVEWISVDTTYFITAAVPQVRVPTGWCQLGMTIFDTATPGAWTLSSSYFTNSILQLPGSIGGCVPQWLAARAPQAPSCLESLDRLGVREDASRKEIDAAWNTLRASSGDTKAIDAAHDALMGRRSATYRFKLFQGPKDHALLAQTGGQPLRDSLDLGIFGFIAKPLHQLLVWLHGGVGSWALAIILLTIIVKLVLLPLTNKSYRSMQKMQKLKPKLDKLKAELGDDRQKFAQEQMALFKREGVNPLGGCLPMVLQMPVWFGLYQTIYSSVELYRAPMGLWIHDLSAPDPFYILPIVLGLLMFVQTMLTTSTGAIEGMQGKLLKFGMPVMFSVFMLFLPAGLVLYILVNVILTIGQNVFIRRRMGMK